MLGIFLFRKEDKRPFWIVLSVSLALLGAGLLLLNN